MIAWSAVAKEAVEGPPKEVELDVGDCLSLSLGVLVTLLEEVLAGPHDSVVIVGQISSGERPAVSAGRDRRGLVAAT